MQAWSWKVTSEVLPFSGRNMDDRMQELQNRLAKLDADDDAVASLRAEWEE